MMSQENLNENMVENYLEGLEPCHEFVPKSLTDHQVCILNETSFFVYKNTMLMLVQ